MSCECGSKTCQHPLSVSKSYVDAVVKDLQDQFDAANLSPSFTTMTVVDTTQDLFGPPPAEGSVRLVRSENSLFAYTASWGGWRRIGRPRVYYSNSTPAQGMVGDLWVDSDLVVRGLHDGAYWRPMAGVGGGAGGGTAQDQTYGEHVITWSGDYWVYRGSPVTVRPTIPSYFQGAYVVWDTSLDIDASPPSLAAPGDKWHPHPDAVI